MTLPDRWTMMKQDYALVAEVTYDHEQAQATVYWNPKATVEQIRGYGVIRYQDGSQLILGKPKVFHLERPQVIWWTFAVTYEAEYLTLQPAPETSPESQPTNPQPVAR